MKWKINAKTAIRCGRAMSKLFYKFPVSTDPLKFFELFAELADLKPIENVSPISQHREFDFDLIVGWIDQLECEGTSRIPQNPNYDVEDFSNPDVDEVPDDIDDEGLEEVEDVHDISFSNSSRGIILRNEPRGDMLNVDPNAAHASKFSEYTDIVPAHRLAVNSQFEELFIRQQFKNKADCVFAIKQYSIKLSIDYNVVKSTPTLYVGEFWRASDGAFPHCKPLVQVDGTWLYGKYTQILLIVVAQDGNGNVLPIAFAIMESENSESWESFIRNLRRHVVRQDNICIISDKSKGLVAAIRQSEVSWRSIYCICHIDVNFHNEYKNRDWRKPIVNMGKNIVFKFVFVIISSPIPNSDGNAFYRNTYIGYELEAHRFRHKLARLKTDMTGSNPSLRQWLSSIEPWQWAQCFDEGYQYGQMTTNLVKAIN
ncbi:hypothetical protein J1N35_026194 [Gossypium stocksii]|uniref:MULE transposase domain-containing protein n=1 Tax=Gossypium stocksii TaxID=47602 RepID=A0A9D3V9B9_9ROSI|nr:hypothetical protein J1N35_026194 [Gossypium stocksii]